MISNSLSFTLSVYLPMKWAVKRSHRPFMHEFMMCSLSGVRKTGDVLVNLPVPALTGCSLCTPAAYFAWPSTLKATHARLTEKSQVQSYNNQLCAVLNITGHFVSRQALGDIYQFPNAHPKACWVWESVACTGHHGWDEDLHRAQSLRGCLSLLLLSLASFPR